MSADKELTDILLTMTQGNLKVIDEFRQVGATLQVVSGKLGKLCDDLQDYTRRSDDRHRESESKIRVLETKQDELRRRLEPIEAAYKAGLVQKR